MLRIVFQPKPSPNPDPDPRGASWPCFPLLNLIPFQPYSPPRVFSLRQPITLNTHTLFVDDDDVPYFVTHFHLPNPFKFPKYKRFDLPKPLLL